MKKIITLIYTLFCFSFLYCQGLEWSNIGPGGGSDLHFLAIQPDNKDVIYVGGDIEGIFKTINGGQTWNSINNNIAQLTYGAGVYWINDIQIDPVDFEKVYLCTGVGLFSSNNGGDNWQLIYPDTIDGDEHPTIGTSTIGIDPTNTSRLFLGLGDQTGDCSFGDFEPFPGYEDPWGVYRSMDGGQSWTLNESGLPDSISIHTIDIIPNSDTVIMTSNFGVFRSDNGGASWNPKNLGLPHNNTHRLKVDNYNGDNILTLTLKTIGDVEDPSSFSGGIFRSYDMGESWFDITGDLPKYDYDDFLFYDYWKFDTYPGDPDRIFLATNRGSGFAETGIFSTVDGGNSWELIYTPVIGGWMDTDWLWEGYAFDIMFAPSDPSRIVICLLDVEISNDTGLSWNQAFTTQIGPGWKGIGLELMNTEAVSFHPNDTAKRYVGYDDMGLFRSDDSGNSFIRLDSHQDPEIEDLSDIDAAKEVFVDPDNGDLYIERFQGSMGGYSAGFSSGGIAFSDDDGATVHNITGSMPFGRHDIIVDFNSGSVGNRTLYSAVFHHGVYKSTNSGSAWMEINSGLGNDAQYVWDIAINPINPQELFIGTNSWSEGENGGLYKSDDGGQNWIHLAGLPDGDITKVTISKAQDVYVCVTDNFEWNTSGGLYRSEDGGESWTEILNNSRLVDVQVNPFIENIIVAVAQQWYKVSEDQQGIYLSYDKGLSWELISQNTDHTNFNFACFNPHNPNQLYAGTGGGGLWQTNLDITIGVPENRSLEIGNIYIFPNPSKNKVNIDLRRNYNEINVKLINSSGQQVFNATYINRQSIVLDLNRFPAGLYLMQIKSENETTVRKLMINTF